MPPIIRFPSIREEFPDLSNVDLGFLAITSADLMAGEIPPGLLRLLQAHAVMAAPQGRARLRRRRPAAVIRPARALAGCA
jgi:hypothetical protein